MVNIDSVNSFQAEWTTPWTEIQVFHKNRVRICQDPLPSFEPMWSTKEYFWGRSQAAVKAKPEAGEAQLLVATRNPALYNLLRER